MPDALTVCAAGIDEKPIVASLLQLYLHDFSAFTNIPLNDQGQFTYLYFDHYWRDQGRYPLLFRQGAELVGFALVREERDPEDGELLREMAEFFILRRWRRRGLGQQAAERVLRQSPGRWRLSVLAGNHGALPFWGSVLQHVTTTANGLGDSGLHPEDRNEATTFKFEITKLH